MPNVICNTSPLQYLHQLQQLELLPKLYHRIIVPTAVVQEIERGRQLGIELPSLEKIDWITIQTVTSRPALSMIVDLGDGEKEVLGLASEMENSIVIIDDLLARKFAHRNGVRVTGTLGVLLKAKKSDMIMEVKPFLDELVSLQFHIDNAVRDLILQKAAEL